jgi:hypothetical protein
LANSQCGAAIVGARFAGAICAQRTPRLRREAGSRSSALGARCISCAKGRLGGARVRTWWHLEDTPSGPVAKSVRVMFNADDLMVRLVDSVATDPAATKL